MEAHPDGSVDGVADGGCGGRHRQLAAAAWRLVPGLVVEEGEIDVRDPDLTETWQNHLSVLFDGLEMYEGLREDYMRHYLGVEDDSLKTDYTAMDKKGKNLALKNQQPPGPRDHTEGSRGMCGGDHDEEGGKKKSMQKRSMKRGMGKSGKGMGNGM